MSPAHPLDGLCVVITGAARGIGEAAARAIAADGAFVVLIDSDARALNAVADSLGAGSHLTRRADVRNADDLRGITDDLRAQGRAVDALVNNAAVYAQGPLLDLAEEDLRRCVEVNTLGPIACCRAFVPLMRGRAGAHVLNVLSEFAWLPFPNKAAYCISKAAAAMASAGLRTELGPHGIRVSDFVPPAVDTGLIRNATTTRSDLLAREVDVVRAHAWPAERVGRRIAKAIRRPRPLITCGLTTRCAILAARTFPVLTSTFAGLAARRMKLWE